ncbi:hypothetical protein [Sandaracinus amylolyticus]|uniref:4-vinyl reductase 4VR domain-containing protein n=1 Tax=Sandaracinus amylolyticus TaxID=927083 RepID=A0A0F6WAL8_9BACT|nr:hypothetical protein [Sandaracinus amylolyticus]AKF11602.1 hypothetical protein DB32_008751 [Sandaracinus amylolyticus]
MMGELQIERATVSGRSVLAIVQAVRSFSVLVTTLLDVMQIQTRDASGALAVDPEAWYPVRHYLVTYKKIDSLLGGRGLEKVGSLVPSNAVFPPNIKDVRAALASIDVAYHMNHQLDGKPMFDPATGAMLEGIGHYRCEAVPGKNEVRLVCDDAYPCRFDLGLIRGMAHRFEAGATVTHDAHGPCRTKGGASCTYIVTW